MDIACRPAVLMAEREIKQRSGKDQKRCRHQPSKKGKSRNRGKSGEDASRIRSAASPDAYDGREDSGRQSK